MIELTPEEQAQDRKEKVAFLTEAIEQHGIDDVRATILSYVMDGYIDMSRTDMVDAIQELVAGGCKGINEMTTEELADELDLQELQIIFEV